MPQWSGDDQAFARALQKLLEVEQSGLQTGVAAAAEPSRVPVSGGSDDIGDVSWVVPTGFLSFPSNVPGMLGRLNQAFSNRGLNIAAQHLQTDRELGYVVIEAEGEPSQSQDALEEIRAMEGTIRARLLY